MRAAAAAELPAARAALLGLARSMQLVGDPVQPADHGPVGIEHAAAPRVERAEGSGIRTRPGLFGAPGLGPVQNFRLLCRGQPLEAVPEAVILHQGVVMEPGAAAAVLAARAGKPIGGRRLFVGGVHGGIQQPQALQEVCANRRIHQLTFSWKGEGKNSRV